MKAIVLNPHDDDAVISIGGTPNKADRTRLESQVYSNDRRAAWEQYNDSPFHGT